MDEKSFKKDLACGLGRCYLFLSDCKDKNPYRKIVLDSCLENPCFDTQCEGTRAKYLYELIKLFDDDGYFLPPVIDKFNSTDEEYGWEFEHLCDLVLQFAKDGNKVAADALKAMYGKLYSLLLNKRDCGGYDYHRDNFERVSVNLVALYGVDWFIRIAEDMGKLFMQNDRYDGWDFESFYFESKLLLGENCIRTIENSAGNSPALKEFFRSINEALKPVQHSDKPRLVREYASTNEVYDIDEIIKKFDGLTIDRDNESEWHGVFIDLLKAAENGADLPKSALEFIYNNSLCSCCRNDAVKAMNARGWLTEDIIRECGFDSYADTREYVKKVKI